MIGEYGQWSPGGSKVSLIGQAVIKKDRELMSLEGMERRILVCGPPA